MSKTVLEKTIESLLAERGASYGDFATIAGWIEHAMAEKLSLLDNNPSWRGLPRPEKAYIVHALYMMTTKEARLLHGDVTLPDNFDDIAGYAKLVSKMLNEGPK